VCTHFPDRVLYLPLKPKTFSSWNIKRAQLLSFFTAWNDIMFAGQIIMGALVVVVYPRLSLARFLF